MTTTDTDPDVQVSNASTGEVYPSQVMAEVDRLDGAATDGRWLPAPRQIPDHVAALLRPLTRAQLDAEDTPAAGDHIPDTAGVRDRIRLAHASGRLASRLDGQAQVWREVAHTAWAAQAGTPHDSEHYTARREALLSAYERECEAIKAGLTRTSVEYGGHTYDDQRGFVPSGAPQREPDQIANTPDVAMMETSGQADNRSGLDKLKKRVPTALTASQPQTPAAENTREPWWMRVLRWIGGAA